MMPFSDARATSWLVVLVLTPLVAAACDDLTGPDSPGLEGGVVATFRVIDETFRVWTDDPDAIVQLEALRSGESQANIPLAPVREGPGRADHNEPWSWHLHPDSLTMAEVTTEVCDGRPSAVEEDLDYWIETVGRYCPWGAELVKLEDHR